jgi:hypothetical protein
MLNSAYGLHRFGPGVIGYEETVASLNTICGSMLHIDTQLNPLWMNSGFFANKRNEFGKKMFRITHYAVDTDFDALWEWEGDRTPFCLVNDDEGTEVGERTGILVGNISPEMSFQLDGMKRLFSNIVNYKLL